MTWLSEKLYHDTESLLPNTLLLWTLGQIYVLLKKPWCWQWLKAGGEGDDRGWDGWMASPTRRTWVWVLSGSWWWMGRPGVLQSMGSQGVWHNSGTGLNWCITGGVFFFVVWVWKTVKWGLGWFSQGTSSKEPSYRCRRLERLRFDLWVGKIASRRAWQPSLVFLPGESPWTEEPGGLLSRVSQRVRRDWARTHKIQLCLFCCQGLQSSVLTGQSFACVIVTKEIFKC